VPTLTVSASASPSTVDKGDSVAFSGSAGGGRAPFAYSWSFGDGGSSTLQNPSHAYATAGTYHGSLTVTDANGSTATANTSAIVVNPLPGVAVVASPSTGDAPLSVALGATPSGGTAPYNYSWSFGDGTPASTTQNPSHIYGGAGTYLTQVTLTDSAGHAAQAGVSVAVAPALNATASASPTSGNAPLTVNLVATVTGGRTPYSYSWNFGDGSIGSTSQNPSHVYANSGVYNATLAVTDANGVTVLRSAPAVSVQPGRLVVTASASPLAGDAPLPVTLHAIASGGTPAFSYSWTFGDGSGGSGPTPVHTYAAGTFTATVTVTDSGSQVATASVSVTVSPQLGGTATATPNLGDAPLQVNFVGSGSGGLGGYSYAWSFGDGTTSTSQNPIHSYAAGSYNPTLTVSDGNGGSVVVHTSSVITVNPPPMATSSVDLSAGDAPMSVHFTGGASAGTPPFSFSWDFGDSSPISTSQNPSHVYAVPGTNHAVLTVTDNAGATAKATTLTILVNPVPTLTASAAPSTGDAPLAVTLTALVSGGTAPFSYAWNFGDTQTGSGATANHTYAAGSYTATVTVTDAAGLKAAAVTTSISVAPGLTAIAAASSAGGQAPLTINFTGVAAGGRAPYTYGWGFGDGSRSNSQNPAHTFTVAGNYTVTLSVSDNNAGAAVKTISVQVTAPAGTPSNLPNGSGSTEPSPGPSPGTADPGKSPVGATTVPVHASPSPEPSPSSPGGGASSNPSRGTGPSLPGSLPILIVMLIALAAGGGLLFRVWTAVTRAW